MAVLRGSSGQRRAQGWRRARRAPVASRGCTLPREPLTLRAQFAVREGLVVAPLSVDDASHYDTEPVTMIRD